MLLNIFADIHKKINLNQAVVVPRVEMNSFLLILCLLGLPLSTPISEPTLKFGFKFVNYNFQTPEEEETYIANKEYENCMIAGVKVNSVGNYFVSVPRWTASNIPATLNKVIPPKNDLSQPLLDPFPSWEMNQVGMAYAFQSVLGFEIDKHDKMWVLDQGKVKGEAAIEGSIKLVKVDSRTGEVEGTYPIPESEASLTRSFMNDVVVDVDKGFAYITDSGISTNTSQPVLGGILTFNIKNETFNRVLTGDKSTSNDPSIWVTINGEHVTPEAPMSTGADGLALSCDYKTLYWTPLSSRTLYALNTELLQDFSQTTHYIRANIAYLGFKGSASDGLSFTSDGQLLLTSIEHSAVYSQENMNTNTQNFFYKNFQTLAKNKTTMLWPDTIGFDGSQMVFVSNQLNNFLAGTIDFHTPIYGKYNYRIWSVDIGTRSYVMGCDKRNKAFPTWASFLIVFGVLGGITLILVNYNCWVRQLIINRKKVAKERKLEELRAASDEPMLDAPSHA